MYLSNQNGFTFFKFVVWFLAVIILIAASFALYDFGTMQMRNHKRLSAVKELEKKLDIYYNENSRYPIECSWDGTDEKWGDEGGSYHGATNRCYKNLEDNINMELPDDPLSQDGFEYRYVSNGSEYFIYYKEETVGDEIKIKTHNN